MASQLELHNEVSEYAANGAPKNAGAIRHPLDPLSAAELQNVVAILRREGHLAADVRIVSINLTEPAKPAVEKYKSGDPYERKALPSYWIAASVHRMKHC